MKTKLFTAEELKIINELYDNGNGSGIRAEELEIAISSTYALSFAEGYLAAIRALIWKRKADHFAEAKAKKEEDSRKAIETPRKGQPKGD